MKTILVAAFLLSSLTYADDYVDFDTPIDIDGTYEVSGVGQADKVKAYRQKLELHNEMLMKKKIEKMRLEQEIKLMQNIQNAFNKSMDNLDKIQ